MKPRKPLPPATPGRILVLSGLLCGLAACGGGGGSHPEPRSMDSPPPPPPPPTLSIELEPAADGPTAARVRAYLSHMSRDTEYGPVGLARFAAAPTVRIAEGTPDHERALVHHAVAVVNRELPDVWHLRIGPDAPDRAAIEAIPELQIFVDFAPQSAWKADVRGPAAGIAQGRLELKYDARQRRWENQALEAAHIWIAPDGFGGHLSTTLPTLLHEFLHALGLYAHLDPGEFPTALLSEPAPPGSRSDRVPEIDGASLRALYTRYPSPLEPEALTAASLGPWETTSTRLTGRIGDVSFGVDHRHGVSVPWTSGLPVGAEWTERNGVGGRGLANNPSLTGTVTWNGGLVGFAPGVQPVTGEAEIRVEVETLTGRADFTALQAWPVGQAPGASGTGTPWGDGDLGYTLSVTGNYLRSTGGDPGTLAGNFYGYDHVGVAGSLERTDLKAAFGAVR